MKEKESFNSWFNENSGYDLHRPSRRRFTVKTCCGKAPLPTAGKILYPHPETGRMEPFVLYQCPSCKSFFVKWGECFGKIDYLMKYQILSESVKNTSQK